MQQLLRCGLIALACGCGAAASGPAPIARFARASGNWDRVAALETRSRIAVGGLTGETTALEDVRTGRYISHTTLGPTEQHDGFDGTARWEQTIGGEVVVLDAPAARQRAVTERWLTMRGYTRAGSAAYRELPAATEGTRTFHVVEATPAGGAPVALWLDDATGLLARTVHRSGSETVTTTYSDYRPVDGVMLAFHQVIDSGDPRNQMVLDLVEAHARPGVEAAAFAPPKMDDRLSFTRGTTTEVPFDLVNNHIYVNAQVDGQPVRVLVDTGGLNLLTPAAVQRLGLQGSGKLAISGAGERKVDVGFAKAQQLTVGGLQLRAPVFYVVDFEQLADVEGEPIDGLVGFEMFQRTAVTIDYPRRTLVVQARDGFTPPAAPAVPFELRDRTPIVSGAVDGLAGRFTIDTGARNALTIHAPFARSHGLAAKYRPRFETVTGWGVGGASRARPVRVQEVRLGDVRVPNVVGELYSGDKGAFADPELAGNIGGAILRRFVVTFDYRDKKLYLAPAAQPPPDIFDRAGMFFLRDGDAIKLVAIVPDGPAAKAGLVEGDRVVAIDGQPIAARALAAWRDVLSSGEVGSKHTLRLTGGADRTLVLAELLP